jgi:hypothetical protein
MQLGCAMIYEKVGLTSTFITTASAADTQCDTVDLTMTL